MKKIIFVFCIFLFISIFSFLFFFHSAPVRFNTITVAGKFSISVPEYLSKTNSIDPAAVLQYKNEKEQLFLLVYEKTDSLHLPIETLFKNFSAAFISKMGRGTLVKYYPAQINSHPAIIGNIRGMVNETGVYYRVAMILSEDSYYAIIIGVADTKRDGREEDMKKIINKFLILTNP